MQRNLKLLIAYDGTGYQGWQSNGRNPSIEATLQRVLERLLQEPLSLQAASRTDAGVHAAGQVVNIKTSTKRSTEKLLIGINALLPLSIRCLKIDEMPWEFHPTLDNIGKEYHYYICNGVVQLPQHRNYSWHYPIPLDINVMRRAAHHLLGENNFRAFCNNRKDLKEDFVRTIDDLQVIAIDSQRLKIVIGGNNFLYRMARNIVGTLVYTGVGKINPDDIPLILTSHRRCSAGISAPAHGLTLYKVRYLA
ncbi:MAG: tRNA pseudouridine(38-40) synthase TruA [Chlamydiota bacterium]